MPTRIRPGSTASDVRIDARRPNPPDHPCSGHCNRTISRLRPVRSSSVDFAAATGPLPGNEPPRMRRDAKSAVLDFCIFYLLRNESAGRGGTSMPSLRAGIRSSTGEMVHSTGCGRGRFSPSLPASRPVLCDTRRGSRCLRLPVPERNAGAMRSVPKPASLSSRRLPHVPRRAKIRPTRIRKSPKRMRRNSG